MTKKIIFLGGKGDPLTIASAISEANASGADEWMVAGFLNDRLKPGSRVGPYEVLGGLEQVGQFLDEGYYFINGIYRIDGNRERIQLFEDLAIPDSRLVNFIHPTAYVAPGVEFGPGCIVMPNVCISQSVRFGKCCTMLQGATVGHDNEIGDFVHISAQACLGAFLEIHPGVHVGMNSTVRENVSMGAFSALGMASALLTDIGPDEIWVGNPARFLRSVR